MNYIEPIYHPQEVAILLDTLREKKEIISGSVDFNKLNAVKLLTTSSF